MKSFLRAHQLCSRFDCLLQTYCRDIFSLGVRAFIAAQFLKAGLAKLGDWSVTVELFRDEYQVPLLSPELAAFTGAAGELIFGALLLFGLFSRLSALGLLLVNIMAVVSYPILWSIECPAALNDHFYWGLLLCVIAIFGAGRFSIDHYLERFSKV